MLVDSAPGVYREDAQPGRQRLQTGVCAIIGAAPEALAGPSAGAAVATAAGAPVPLRRLDAFRAAFPRASEEPGHLAPAVQGFFANGGELCYVVPVAPAAAGWLDAALAAIAPLDELDLVCAPAIMAAAPAERPRLQRALVEHCEADGRRFAILDALPGRTPAEVVGDRAAFDSRAGALYYPWIRVAGGRAVPPSGHIAGVYARNDREAGFFRAPANYELAGAYDLAPRFPAADQSLLHTGGVNALRAVPGRGIRVWGARTLAGPRNTEWAQVGVRRLFLTVGRWLEGAMAGLAFQPNSLATWVRVRRELGDYLWELWRQGGLAGDTPEAAFYVKCDAELNPEPVRRAGLLVVEIGLAPLAPAEFIVARIVQRDGQTIAL